MTPRFQKLLSNPLTQIVNITKKLTTIDRSEAVKNEDDEDVDEDMEETHSVNKDEAINFDVQDGIYQAGDLVKIFRDILQRMNASDTPAKDTAVSHCHEFPMNDMNPSSKFKMTIDWEDIMSKDDKE